MKTKIKSGRAYNCLPACRQGFTLIEVLITVTLIAIFTGIFILNFRPSAGNKTARVQAASVIISDIRSAESMALSGARNQGNFVCGYGVHYVDSTTYLIYAKAVPTGASCSSVATRNYNASLDSPVNTKKVLGTSIVMRSAFSDIFFEPPDPKIYINNNSSLTLPPVQIILQLNSPVNCSGQQCTNINVYTSGQLDLQ